MERFETPRLTAERLRADHFAGMALLQRDPEVSRHLSGPRPADGTERYMAAKLAHWDQHGFGRWVLRTRDGAEVALAVADIGLGRQGFPSLTGFASARNAASHRVLDKSGFGLERKTTFKGDDVVVYRRRGRSAFAAS